MKKRTWILGERTPLRFVGAGLLAFSFLTAGRVALADGVLQVLDNVADDLRALTETVAPSAMLHIIVGSDTPLSESEQIRIEMLVASMGGSVSKSSFDSFNGYAASIPADRIADLAHDPASKHMVPDRRVMPTMDVALPTIGGTGSGSEPAAGLNLLGILNRVTAAVSPLTGNGVTVAVIDSGIGVNPDLKSTGQNRLPRPTKWWPASAARRPGLSPQKTTSRSSARISDKPLMARRRSLIPFCDIAAHTLI